MINHIVLLKFKPGVSEVDIEELERMLDELPNNEFYLIKNQQRVVPAKFT